MAAGKQFELLFQLTARLGPNFSQSFKNASRTMKMLQNDLKGSSQKLKDVSAYQKQQNAVQKSRQRVSELQQEHEKLTEEIEQTGQATPELTKKIQANEKALQKAQNAAAREEERLGELSNTLREAGVNTDRLGQDTNELRQQYERLEQTQRKVNELTEKQAANKAAISQTKAQLGGLVGTATAVGAAIYAGPVKKAAEFREQMSTVSAISGATGTELQMLSEKAKEMGAKTKFTAKEAGEAMEYMAMAGWKSKDMLGGIEGIMDLAAASGEELGSVSDIVTDALTAFGLTASDAGHFADVLAQASSNANTNVGMMGETFKYVAPVAGALGYTAEDTANLIGLMANSGIKASQAGTSLRKIFLGLQGGVKLTGDKLGKYHLEVENADGSMRKLEDVTKDLREAFGQMTEAEKAANAEKIAGKTGMSGLLAIVNASEKDYQKLTKSIEECDGAAKRMAKTKLDNLNGSITLAQSAFDALQVELGELLLPTLTEGVKKFTDITSAVTTFVRENPEAVKAVAKIVTGLVGIKAGGLVAKLGFLEIKGGILSIQKAFTMIKGLGITKYLSSMGGGFGGILTKILPLAGVIAAVGGAIFYVSKHLDQVRGFIQKTYGNEAVAVFDKLWGIITQVGAAVKNAFSVGSTGILDTLADILPTIINTLQSSLLPLLPLIADAIAQMIPLIGQLVTSVLPIIAQMIPLIGQLAASVLPVIVQLIQAVLPILAQIIQEILPVLIQLVSAIVPVLIQFIQEVLPAIIQLMQALLPVIMQLIQAALPVVISLINALLPIIQAVIQVVQALVPVVTEAVQAVLTVVSSVIQNIMTVLQGIITFVTGVFTGNWKQAWDGVVSVFRGVWDTIKGIAEGAMNGVLSVIDKVSGAVGKIKSAVSGAVGKAGKALHIPGFAKGTDRTPDTFIAGENGPELITNAPGMKVYTKEQTRRILDNMDKAKKLNAERGAKNNIIPFVPEFAKGTDRTPDTFLAGENGPELITRAANRSRFAAAQAGKRFNNMAQAGDLNAASNVNTGVTGAGTITIHVTNNHTVNVKGGETDGIKEQLQQYDEEFLEKIRQIIISILREQQEQEGRVAYA